MLAVLTDDTGFFLTLSNFDKVDQVGDLAGIDDAQPVDVPAHGIARLAHPPVVVFAESDNTPIEGGSGLSHDSIFGAKI